MEYLTSRRWIAALLIGAAAARIAVHFYGAAPVEDAWITLRYSRNIASGLGFVYNRGEAVLGTTTPLWALLNAFYIRLFGAATVVAFAFWLNMLFSLATIVLIAAVLTRAGFKPITSWGAVLPLAFFSPFVFSTVSGMETSLFYAILAFSLYSFQSDNRMLAFASAGLLALCRPEGYLWLGFLLLTVTIERRKLPWREAGVSAAVVAPWLVFSTWRFGTIIPHSAIAKSPFTYGSLARGLESGLQLLPKTFLALTFLGYLPRVGSLNGVWPQRALELLAACMFLLGAMMAVRRRGTREMVLFFLVLILFYSLAVPDILCSWYGVPPSLLFYPILMLGLWRVCGFAVKRFSRPLERRPNAPWVLACGALLVLLVPGLAIRAHHLELYSKNEADTRKAIGLFFAQQTPAEATVMLEPIGYIGYFSGRYVYDLAGLVSPAITKLRQESPSGWCAKAIFSFLPDYIVLRDYEIPQNYVFVGGGRFFSTSQERADFFSRYTEVRKFAGDTVDGNQWESYVVFQKRSRAQSAQP